MGYGIAWAAASFVFCCLVPLLFFLFYFLPVAVILSTLSDEFRSPIHRDLSLCCTYIYPSSITYPGFFSLFIYRFRFLFLVTFLWCLF